MQYEVKIRLNLDDLFLNGEEFLLSEGEESKFKFREENLLSEKFLKINVGNYPH